MSEHSAEIQCGQHGRVPKGEVGDPDPQGVFGAEEELHGAAFLGEGLLAEHSGTDDEQTIIEYIRHQEAEEKRLEQMRLEGL